MLEHWCETEMNISFQGDSHQFLAANLDKISCMSFVKQELIAYFCTEYHV